MLVMIKAVTIIVCVFILMLLMPGCWDRSEVEELGIVVAIGIDYDSEEDIFEFTSAVSRPIDLAGGEEPAQGSETKPFRLVTTRGTTLSGALEQQNALLSRTPFFSHNEIIILGESLCRKGVHLVLDRLVRERDMRMTMQLVVTDENVKEVMRSGAKLEQGLPLELRQMLKLRHQLSFRPLTDLRLFSRDLVQAGADPYLPLLSTREETPVAPQEIDQAGQVEEEKIRYPKVFGTAVFREDKLAGFLKGHETKGLLYVKGDILDARETIEDPYGKTGKVVLIPMNARSEIIPLWEEGRPRVLLKIEVESDICCQTSASNLFTEEAFHVMQNKLEEVIKAHIRSTLDKSQKWQADIFAVGREFNRRMPENWEKMQGDWREIYASLDVDIKVKSRIRRSGMVERAPFYEYHTEEEGREEGE